MDSAAIFNIYLLLIISRVFFPQTILLARNENKIILMASVLEIIVNVTCSLILLHFYGIIGIAYGTQIAFFFEKIFLGAYLSLKKKIFLPQYLSIKIWMAYSIVLVTAYFFTR
jgi:O-antigen/teichoic acid export membrane protein